MIVSYVIQELAAENAELRTLAKQRLETLTRCQEECARLLEEKRQFQRLYQEASNSYMKALEGASRLEVEEKLNEREKLFLYNEECSRKEIARLKLQIEQAQNLLREL